MSLNRDTLEQAARDRRDVEATWEQGLDVQRLEPAFRHKAVLLSRTQLKAEAYLQKN